MNAKINYSEIQSQVMKMTGRDVTLSYRHPHLVCLTSMVNIFGFKKNISLDLEIIEVCNNTVHVRIADKLKMAMAVGLITFLQDSDFLDTNEERGLITIHLSKIQGLDKVLKFVALNDIYFVSDGVNLDMSINDTVLRDAVLSLD